MKITAKILLINFLLVVIFSLSITILYHTTASKYIKDEIKNSLVSSANNFSFHFENYFDELEGELNRVIGSKNSNRIPSDYELDIVYIPNQKAYFSNKIKGGIGTTDLNRIIQQNPNLILKEKDYKGNEIYFGVKISEALLNKFSEKLKADVGFVLNTELKDYSSKPTNSSYFSDLLAASKEVRINNEYDILQAEVFDGSLLSTFVTPQSIFSPEGQPSFMLFNLSKQVGNFQSYMGRLMLIIIIAGSFLALVFTFLFTSGFREKIRRINTASKEVKEGNLDHRIDSKGNDELSKLSSSFNGMLEEIQTKNRKEKEYMEFISLINENPALERISEVSLKKIIEETNIPVGLLYVVENEDAKLVSTYGIEQEMVIPAKEINTFKNVIHHKEKLEYFFEKDFPRLKTGSAEINIKYLLIVPIEFNNKVIGILELASYNPSHYERTNYIDEIKDQLGVGLYNALSRQKLENYVAKLKELNEAYQEQNTEIKAKNEKLTELHNQVSEYAEELRKQKNQIEESSKMKTQFLANVTHEFKTPLNSIIGLTDILLRKTQSQNIIERLNIIQRNSKKLLNIISNILEFAKIENAKIQVHSDEFELKNLIDEISNFIKPLADEKNLNYRINLNDLQKAILKTDKTKFEQIIINLLSNSIKFTEEGYVSVSFNSEGNDLQMEVKDSGIGISEKNQKQVFEEFKQVDGGISRKYGGTGLGLTITKKYVELLGGSIELKSKLGEGVHFKIKMPNLIYDKAEHSASAGILIYSKDERFIDFYSEYLNENEFTVDKVSGKESLLELADKNAYKEILVDNNLGNGVWKSLFELKDKKEIKTSLIPVALDYTRNTGAAIDLHDYFVLRDHDSFWNHIQKYEEEYKKEAKKILVLDDNKENIDAIISQTESEQIEIKLQETFDLEGIREYRPNMIFINIAMKSLNSFKLISELREVREFNYKQLIGYVPKQPDDSLSKTLTIKMNELLRENSFHLYDTLKLLRKKLNIKENVKVKEKLLFDEKEISSLSYIDQKTVSDKILIVDDDSDTLYTVGDMIKELNYTVEFAEDGYSALESIQEAKPALILLDIMMPGMDGFETVRKIREFYKPESLPVLALTAYAMIDDKEVLKRNGFNDLVSKPVKMVDLKNKIEQFLVNQEELNYEQNISSG